MRQYRDLLRQLKLLRVGRRYISIGFLEVVSIGKRLKTRYKAAREQGIIGGHLSGLKENRVSENSLNVHTPLPPTTNQFNPYYLGNLTYLTARVRAEMFAASETLTWRCLEEIPVINGWILAGE
jgi:hypothetical protein